jgi:hypothetical protein
MRIIGGLGETLIHLVIVWNSSSLPSSPQQHFLHGFFHSLRPSEPHQIFLVAQLVPQLPSHSTMDKGEVFTPLSEITGQNAGARVQKQQQQQPAQQPPTTKVDPDKAKKIGQVHFKASHGLVVAFFSLLLYVSGCRIAFHLVLLE